MTAGPVLALPPRDTDDDGDGHGGHDTPQRPETDAWPYFKVRQGPNHLKHAGHGWRD